MPRHSSTTTTTVISTTVALEPAGEGKENNGSKKLLPRDKDELRLTPEWVKIQTLTVDNLCPDVMLSLDI